MLSYPEVLSNARPVGERVALIGAGGIGFDVAEYLSHGADRRAALRPEEVTPPASPLHLSEPSLNLP